MANESPEHSAGLVERAWRDLQRAMAKAARTVAGPAGARNSLERAEGFRYLTGLLSAGLEMHLEKADPARPAFTRMLTPTRKFLGDNPDTLYEYVPLDGSLGYRVRGRRGSEIYLGFCVYERDPDGITTIGANLSDAEMHFEDDGSFEVVLSDARPDDAKNWLAISNQANSMIARRYFRDRTRDASESLEIEPLSPVTPPAPLAEEELAERLACVGRFVKETSELSAALSVFAALKPVGRESQPALQVIDGEVRGDRSSARELAASIDPKVVAGHLPTPDIQYTGAWWSLEPDEAVVVQGVPPERTGSARVARSHEEDGFRLGSWAGTQRIEYRRGRIDRERLERLPGWIWDGADAFWEERFASLQRFASRQGHAQVPTRHVEGDFKLGMWVANQRTRKRQGRLDAERARRLESVRGWRWSKTQPTRERDEKT